MGTQLTHATMLETGSLQQAHS